MTRDGVGALATAPILVRVGGSLPTRTMTQASEERE